MGNVAYTSVFRSVVCIFVSAILLIRHAPLITLLLPVIVYKVFFSSFLTLVSVFERERLTKGTLLVHKRRRLVLIPRVSPLLVMDLTFSALRSGRRLDTGTL